MNLDSSGSPSTPAPPSRYRSVVALAIAAAADLLQIFVLPLFLEGALSPVNAALDLVVGALMIRLLGWNWAFLPAFAAELLPVVDLVPTWTAAVLLVAWTKFGRSPPHRER